MYYIRIAETLADKGKLIPHTDDVYKYVNRNKDCYRSIYFYNEEQKKQFDTSKSVAGITEVVTSKLVFDFDSGTNLEQAREDALELCQRLVSKGVNPEDIQVYFSGSKGFGIEMNTTSMLTVQEFKNVTFNLAADLTSFDKVINNASRIIRVPLTKHQTTGNFKIPLTIDELTDLSIDEIVSFSKDISNYDLDVLKEAMGRVIDLPQAVLNLRVRGEPTKPQKVVERPQDVELDLSNKPKFLTNCKYSLQEGHFGSGERNSALMTLAATYKNNGFSKAIVYRMLKGVAQTQSELSGQTRFSDKEIYKNIIEVVFSPTWKGGMYSCQQEGWLRDYCQALGDKCCEKDPDHKHEVGPKLISSVKDKFKHYVKNIDKNTVKTGIGWIDQKLFISTGTNVGIIGAAGCHEKGAEIIMFDGSIKKVEDIIVGDLLMGPDSKPREVLKLHRGREEMVRIHSHRNNPFVVNKSHIMHLVPSHLKNKLSFPGGINITVNNYIEGIRDKKRTTLSGYKLTKPDQITFNNNTNLTIDPYILGVWLGDGHSDGPAITSMDEEIITAWRVYGTQLGLRTRKDVSKSKANVYSLVDCKNKKNPLMEMLRDLNLYKNKHIPLIYKTASIEERKKLLAGLIDTDGHKEANKKGWGITQKSKILAEDILFLARSLGLHASINAVIKNCMYKGERKYGTYYTVYISGENVFGVPCKLKRKFFETPVDLRLNVRHYGINKLEILPEDDYYGFTIDQDHLYLTSDFMIHHNSGKSSLCLDILSNTSKAGVKSVFASLDMASTRMYEKILYRVSGKTREELYQMYQDDREHELEALVKSEFENVFFYDKSSPTVSDIRNYILECERQTGEKIKLVCLDYFERVSSDFSDDTQASKKIAGELQDLVNDLDIALITFVQPNKFSIAGGPDQPIRNYTAIKGSSFLYQSFRQILSLWRPFYNPKDFKDDKYMTMAILKNDLGELDEHSFHWEGKRGMIREMDLAEKFTFEHLLHEKENAGKDDDGL